MSMLVCGGAMLQCTFGMTPGPLMVIPFNRLISPMPVANIMDNKPIMNIPSFGMCSSMGNPAVQAATAAAMGALTPMPCMPMTMAPWVPGSLNVLVGKLPALNHSSKLICNWGGIISITLPGQFRTLVP